MRGFVLEPIDRSLLCRLPRLRWSQVVGVGGGGGNAINRMVQVCAVRTRRQRLAAARVGGCSSSTRRGCVDVSRTDTLEEERPRAVTPRTAWRAAVCQAGRGVGLHHCLRLRLLCCRPDNPRRQAPTALRRCARCRYVVEKCWPCRALSLAPFALPVLGDHVYPPPRPRIFPPWLATNCAALFQIFYSLICVSLLFALSPLATP